MQITWWEYAELLDHLNSRPDIWKSDEGLWIRTFNENEETLIGLGLQFIPPEETGPYRMYSLQPTPVQWSESEVDAYLEKLCFYWTSYSTRVEFAKLMTSELKLDEETAWLMSIALMRATVEPKENPEQTGPPPRVQHLWSDIPSSVSWQDVRGIGHSHGAIVSLVKHHEMIRCQIEMPNPHAANGEHRFRLTGFVRPSGYSIEKFIQMMDARQDEIRTPDPDSQVQEVLFDDTVVNMGDPDAGAGAGSAVDIPQSEGQGGPTC